MTKEEFDLMSIEGTFGGSKAAKTLAKIAHKNNELGAVGKLFDKYSSLFREIRNSNLSRKTAKTLSKRLLAESKIRVMESARVSAESKTYLNNIINAEYRKLLKKI